MPNIPDYYAAHSPKSVVPNTAISRVAARLLPIMAAFSSLTDRLSNAFKHLKSKGKLSEADIDGTIREIRRALLDADVALDVVRSFTGKVRERALGTEVSDALNPAQQVVKIVNEELTDVLGQGVDRPLNFAKNPPTIIMLAGLQGAGKTTLAGKSSGSTGGSAFAKKPQNPALPAGLEQMMGNVDGGTELPPNLGGGLGGLFGR